MNWPEKLYQFTKVQGAIKTWTFSVVDKVDPLYAFIVITTVKYDKFISSMSKTITLLFNPATKIGLNQLRSLRRR